MPDVVQCDEGYEDYFEDDGDYDDYDDGDYYGDDDAPILAAKAGGSLSYQSAMTMMNDPRQRSNNSNNNNMATLSSSSTSHAVRNSVQAMQHLEVHKRTLYQDRNDRATSEQVLDPRTRMILFKMLNTGVLEKLDGCLSTGKEANVY